MRENYTQEYVSCTRHYNGMSTPSVAWALPMFTSKDEYVFLGISLLCYSVLPVSTILIQREKLIYVVQLFFFIFTLFIKKNN